MKKRIWSVPSFTAALLFSAPVIGAEGAAPVASSARENAAAYDRGIEALNTENWAGAERIFAELWRERQTWDVAVSLGQAELNLGRYRDAAEHLAYGIRAFPLRDEPEMLETAKAALAEARLHVGTLRISVNRPGARVLVDGKLIGRSPLDSEVFVDIGTRTIEAQLEGLSSVSEQIVARTGSEHQVDLKFAAPGVALAVPESSGTSAPIGGSPTIDTSSRPNYLFPIVSGSIAVVGAAAWLGFWAAANDDRNTVRQYQGDLGESACWAPASAHPDCETWQDARDRQRRNATISRVGLGVAAAGAAATLGYFLFFKPSREATSSRALYPTVSVDPTGGALLINGGF